MHKISFLRLPFLAILFCCSWAGMLHAQSPNEPRVTITVAVEGLTTEVRDGISRDLQQNGQLRLVYACVPAGVMVFEQLDRGSREQLRTTLTPVLEHRIPRQKIKMETIDRSAAEERCAQVRNR